MASRSMLHSPAADVHVAQHSNNLPRSLTTDAIAAGNLRRGHVGHLPVLTTTALSGQSGHQYSTPLSTVSPYSSLSAHTSSPAVSSPMATRVSGNLGVPYDPRDWAGGNVRDNQARRAREQQGEDGLASPPPPYTPNGISPGAGPSSNSGTPHNVSASYAETSSTPHHAVRHATVPPPQSAIITQHPRSFTGDVAGNRQSAHFGYQPPPPPPSRGTSMTRGMGVVPVQNNVYESRGGSPEHMAQAPAARRAVSASAHVHRQPEMGSSSRSSSITRQWQPGMPLPGPPPGPPPSSSRSQSVSGPSERSSYNPSNRPRPLRPTMQHTELGPVPPTPANWTEENSEQPQVHQPLHINTTGLNQSLQQRAHAENSTSASGSSGNATNSSANLSRSSAIRDPSAKGLRERRAMSRNSVVLQQNHDLNSAISVQTNPWADAMERAEGNSAGLSNEPTSGGRSRLRPKAPTPLGAVFSTNDVLTASPLEVEPTPPLSSRIGHGSLQHGARSAGLPPKSLPTPPLSQKAPLSANSVLPSSGSSIAGQHVGNDSVSALEATKRHTEFLEKERTAKSDAERLQAFADFILNEAAIRASTYSSAIASGDFDIIAVREKLFQIPRKESITSAQTDRTPGRLPERSSNGATPQARPETMWWKEYQPALSTIASVEHDEMSSRGRAPSRWWESQTGSDSGGQGRRVHRTKRESKYMGLSKEFLMAHSPNEEQANPFGSMAAASLDPNSYPQEKGNPDSFGYYEESTPRPSSFDLSKQPASPELLDISRFITLPPPYPRHHPAVNNSHPDLADYRNAVRLLSDFSDIQSRKARHRQSAEAFQSEHQRKKSEGRRAFKNNVQGQINEGSITFAEAAEAEEAFKQNEHEAEKESLKAEFDTLQDVVINPLHDALHDRITQLDASLQRLQDDLGSDAQHHDPDRPQEEGDEKPELLEKLTQLKWLFDTREQIQKECFDLLSDRNDKFKAIILLPYRFANNLDKVRDTEAFFEKDTQTRLNTFCDESLRRHTNFLQTIEDHVARGVELQSSAFWDIAPRLLDLLQKIPDDVRQLEGVKIPAKEYAENPSYHKYPEQYLYTLLDHAEKSTYQFIEGQVNLHCLLHEVKSSYTQAKYRAFEAQDAVNGVRSSNLDTAKAGEESTLTGELKQKASMIEEQWLESLGSSLQGTRERVKALLEEEDAWEEIAQADA